MATPSGAAHAAINGLLAQYAELIDAGDFAGIGDLLADAVITTEDGSVVAAGRDEIVAMYQATTRRYGDGTPCTSHVITNLIVEPDPSESTGASVVARSYFTVFQAAGGVGLAPIIAGRYRDVVSLNADGRWTFVERRMVPRLFGDLSAHLLFDPSMLGPAQ